MSEKSCMARKFFAVCGFSSETSWNEKKIIQKQLTFQYEFEWSCFILNTAISTIIMKGIHTYATRLNQDTGSLVFL